MFAEYKEMFTMPEVSPEEIERQRVILDRMHMAKNFPPTPIWQLLPGRKKLEYVLAYSWYEKKTFEIMPGMVLNFETNAIEYR